MPRYLTPLAKQSPRVVLIRKYEKLLEGLEHAVSEGHMSLEGGMARALLLGAEMQRAIDRQHRD